MTVDMKVIRKALEVCRDLKEESKSWTGSQILGCHAEGPFISESKKGAQDPKYILKPDAKFVKEYADIIKIITIIPTHPTAFFTSDMLPAIVPAASAAMLPATGTAADAANFTARSDRLSTRAAIIL